ncbi:hypothetical protein DC364_21240 [Vibrio vulnificus]|uniref:hypothetical protein n=1 Tax=Vibrio vulnificus TaxID=672 RepID=UPI000D3E9BFB|nr:hypothetical protein [Vibrio vulnificus]MCJ0806743.1 hypothetical protein [Vibrio vulnificus]PUZ91697.1 hypothetical protein DC364_21240 [Vibrio vulnificus]BDP30200.1 hypothetical protein VV208B2_12800 [Vibrio vulnificus]
MDLLLPFSVLTVIVLLFMHTLKLKAYRKHRVFQMFAIRDRLVLMVAQEKISEDSKVFQYYYKRVSFLLELAPNIGLDDMINHMLSAKKAGARRSDIERSRAEADEIAKLKELECEEVRELVADYYRVSKELILAHSSLSRLVMIALLKSDFLKNLAKKFAPKRWLFTLNVVDFMDQEATNIRKHA